LGGATKDGPRHLFWNFVLGDEVEFIPLSEERA
jgi:hypothetical protein